MQFLDSLRDEDIVPAAEPSIHEILISVSALSLIELVLPSLLSALSFHNFIDDHVIIIGIITTVTTIIATIIIAIITIVRAWSIAHQDDGMIMLSIALICLDNSTLVEVEGILACRDSDGQWMLCQLILDRSDIIGN